MDPAAEGKLGYEACADARAAVRVREVMAEAGLGPNGALVAAMDFIVGGGDMDGRGGTSPWLEEALAGLLDDDCLAVDLPGQVELYAHLPVLPRLVAALTRDGFHVCAVFLVDAHFCTDAAKLLAGHLAALAAMCHLELPHVNVLSKCDLVGKEAVERYLTPAGPALLAELHAATPPRFHALNAALASILDEYDMVGFVPLDLTDEDSLDAVLAQVDAALQYGEDLEPREPRDYDDARGGGGGGGDGDDDTERDDGVFGVAAARGGAWTGDGGDR